MKNSKSRFWGAKMECRAGLVHEPMEDLDQGFKP